MDAADLPLTGHPKRSRFRIYRDTRFSDDKRPYKTNLGAVFDRSGAKKKPGVVYVHVEPGQCFLAAGFYQPEVKYLRPVRSAIVNDPDRFERMLATMAERDLPVGPGSDTLTGMPRGFADYRDTPTADYLRWKKLPGPPRPAGRRASIARLYRGGGGGGTGQPAAAPLRVARCRRRVLPHGMKCAAMCSWRAR